MNARTLDHEPKTIVYFLPILSDKMPVGTSNIAEESMVIPKMLVPNVYDPDTLEK